MAGSRRDVKIRKGLAAVQTWPNANQNELYTLLESAKRTLTQVFAQVDSTQLKITYANDYYKLSVALASLLKSQVEYERWQAECHGCILEATELLTHEMQRQLASRPELLVQLRTAIEQSRNQLETQHGASPLPTSE